MTPDPASLPLLLRLHKRIFADAEMRAVLDAAFAEMAAELAGRAELPHVARSVPIGPFRVALLPAEAREVRLCRLFLLGRGKRMAHPERHRNSVQRLVSYQGRGRIHQAMRGGGAGELEPREIRSPVEPATEETDAALLDRYWDIVPAGVWHFPEASAEGDWATVTFHSAAEDTIADGVWRSDSDAVPVPVTFQSPMSAPVRPPPPARRCFVCGPDNPIGLHLVFRLEGGECRSEFTPNKNHQGYPGIVHGGMIYAALDDVMANWLYLQGARAYTARCEIRYRHPAHEGERLFLAGRERSRRRNLVEMEGRATRAADGKVIATATATFALIDAATQR